MIHQMLLIEPAALPQAVGPLWVAMATTPGDARSIVQDAQHNIYICGVSSILKFNSSGALQWERTTLRNAGTSTFEVPQAIAIDSQGNLLVVGNYAVAGDSYGTAIIAKYDSNGSLLWQQHVNQPQVKSQVQSWACTFDEHDNPYVTSRASTVTQTTSSYTGGGTLIKFDPSGNVQWQRSNAFNININILYRDIVATNGVVYAVSDTQGLLTKWDAQGTLLWSKQIAGSSLFGLTVDSQGNITTSGVINATSKALIAHWDSNGNLLWQRTLGATTMSISVDCDAQDNLYIAVNSGTAPSPTNYPTVAKYTSGGALQWQRKFIGLSSTYGTLWATDILADDLGRVFLCGNSPINASTQSLMVLAYPQDGSLTTKTGNTMSPRTNSLVDSGASQAVANYALANNPGVMVLTATNLVDAVSALTVTVGAYK